MPAEKNSRRNSATGTMRGIIRRLRKCPPTSSNAVFDLSDYRFIKGKCEETLNASRESSRQDSHSEIRH